MSEVIEILDLKFQPYISSEKIDRVVGDLARRINEDYQGKNPLFLSVLNGSFIFTSDLLKKISLLCNIEFVRLKSYDGTQSTENVREVLGLTLAHFIDYLKTREPKSIKLASLIFKKEAFQKDFELDYVGFEIENKFIVGYGLDYNEYGRNLDSIYQLI